MTTQEPIVLERTYRAPVSELWDLWTTKAGFESWWGPEGFRADVHAIEPRVGGPLRYDMIAASAEAIDAMKRMGQPTSHPATMTFTDIVAHRRIEVKSLIDFIAGVKPYESAARVEFVPSGDTVRMVVTLTPLHDAQWTERAVMGWTSQLAKLDKRFGAGAARHAT